MTAISSQTASAILAQHASSRQANGARGAGYADALKSSLRQLDQARSERSRELVASYSIKDPVQSAAAQERILSYQTKIAGMMKALESLRASSSQQFAPIISVSTGSGADTVSIWTPGSVADVRTGPGDDVVSISSDTVANVHTGRGDDWVAVSGSYVERVNTQQGDDELYVNADIVAWIDTGAGDDTLSITAGVARYVRAQEGDDFVTIDAVMGGSAAYDYDASTEKAGIAIETADGTVALDFVDVDPAWYELAPERAFSSAEQAAADRMRSAQTVIADVFLDAGDDTLNVRVDEAIAVSGGAGDDVINVNGGTVALQYSGKGDGDDLVRVAAGATVAIQIPPATLTISGELIEGPEWSADWDGDTMVLQIGDGSIRIEGAADAAAIGVMTRGSQQPVMLHLAPALDQRV